MSWCNKSTAMALLALSLSGCLRPLYQDPRLALALREIDVQPVQGRVGHYLTSGLISRLNNTGESATPRYHLHITLSEMTSTPTVESQIQTADSATVTVAATFTLSQDKAGQEKQISSGTATCSAPYNRTLNNFSNLRAGQEAEIRVANALADTIALRLASVLEKTRE